MAGLLFLNLPLYLQAIYYDSAVMFFTRFILCW